MFKKLHNLTEKSLIIKAIVEFIFSVAATVSFIVVFIIPFSMEEEQSTGLLLFRLAIGAICMLILWFYLFKWRRMMKKALWRAACIGVVGAIIFLMGYTDTIWGLYFWCLVQFALVAYYICYKPEPKENVSLSK